MIMFYNVQTTNSPIFGNKWDVHETTIALHKFQIVNDTKYDS